MKVCFTGLGSIAGRHIRNLRELLGDRVRITVLRSGMGAAAGRDIAPLIDRICAGEGELEASYDALFITNPTFLHYDTLLKYHRFSDAFFIEKPVFMDGNEELLPFKDSGKKYYVACPLRYTDVIQYLKEHVDAAKVRSARCISSSYLPDWRPGSDYRNTYSARREMGGGVSADLIHEWDYIQFLLGMPNQVKCMIGKKSNLEIDSDDIALYIADYDDKTAEIHLDYFGRKPQRKLELYCDDETIAADLIAQRIDFLVRGETICFSQERDDYQKRELRHFLDIVKGKQRSDNDLEEACRVLRLARGKL